MRFIKKRRQNHFHRSGSMSLEVLATLAVILPMAVAAFQLARLAYRGLYFVISTWVGSPFF